MKSFNLDNGPDTKPRSRPSFLLKLCCCFFPAKNYRDNAKPKYRPFYPSAIIGTEQEPLLLAKKQKPIDSKISISTANDSDTEYTSLEELQALNLQRFK